MTNNVEPGIHLPGGKFISKNEIARKNALNESVPRMVTDLPKEMEFNYWSKRFERRQEVFKETEVQKNKVSISFDNDTIINFIGDAHIGAPDTDYKRLASEIDIICQTPNSYVMVVGDLIDGFFFNPAQMEQIEQVPEQYKYIRSMLKYLSENKRLLVGWGGDHDGWAKKMGMDPYATFSSEFGAYYMQGVGYITLNVGEQEYKLVGAHRLPGFSMYNNTHPQMRLSRDVQGADIYMGAHTHMKGHNQQDVTFFGGESKMVHYISLGPYKQTDEYAKKKGFAVKTDEGMYGCAIKLSKDSHHIQYFSSILEANSQI